MHIENTHSPATIPEPITRWQGQISKKIRICQTARPGPFRETELGSPEKVLVVWWIIETMDPDIWQRIVSCVFARLLQQAEETCMKASD
jgi:hypothetical protein